MVKKRSRNVTANNWERKKKRASAVEKRDRSSRLRVNSGEGGSTSRNIVGSSTRKNTACMKEGHQMEQRKSGQTSGGNHRPREDHSEEHCSPAGFVSHNGGEKGDGGKETGGVGEIKPMKS